MLEVLNKIIDTRTHVLLLKKAICGSYPSKADHCHFMKRAKADKPMSFVIINVDDGGIIGAPDAIKAVIEALGETLKVETTGKMEKFAGCHIIDRVDKDGVWIHQHKLHKNQNANLCTF
jgi:hypothetical protein